MSKTLKLDHELATAVRMGTKHTTWRVFDEKNISVNDQIELVDKVDPSDMATWQIMGTAVVDQIIEKRMEAITSAEMAEHGYNSYDELYASFTSYYGDSIGPQTAIKIISFTYGSAVTSTTLEQKPQPREHDGAVKLFADGGSRGNPGPSASGYALLRADDTIIEQGGVYLGITTNNQAEYQALKVGLERARVHGIDAVDVYMDSMLVVNQMKGIFKVKNRDLWPIHQGIKEMLPAFSHISFNHVPRERNKIADGEVNIVLDREAKTT